MVDLLPFQRRFVAALGRPDTTIAALSIPRGGGKSTLAGWIAAGAMRTIQPHEEVCLMAGSIEQARIVFRVVRQALGEDGFRYLDSSTRCAITRADGARLRVVGSNAKTTFGLLHVPLVIGDEPGAWETIGGERMYQAIRTSAGKPNSPLKAIFIGTLAPSDRGWWHDLVAGGSRDGVHVQALQGRPEKWDSWREVLRVNPLARCYPELRTQLRRELDEAKNDSRLKAAWMSYRMNVPTRDDVTVLLTVPEWERVIARRAPGRDGLPVVGIDLGGGRAWSAACAIWPNGHTEAVAVAPGTPSIEAQEKRDRVPSGTYSRLIDAGVLVTDGRLRVPRPSVLADRVAGWNPISVACDRFRMSELADALPGVELVPRVGRWSEASEDIRALRRGCLDGPLAVEESSQSLIGASLAVATVKSDDQGNVRLTKGDGSNNRSRDDVAQAWVLAAGLNARRPQVPLFDDVVLVA